MTKFIKISDNFQICKCANNLILDNIVILLKIEFSIYLLFISYLIIDKIMHDFKIIQLTHLKYQMFSYLFYIKVNSLNNILNNLNFF